MSVNQTSLRLNMDTRTSDQMHK